MGRPAGRQGSPMKQKTIDFRELLERLLPIEALPPADRLSVHRALATGVAGQIERAAMHALHQLEQAGAVRRMPGGDPAAPGHVRYQREGAVDVITVQMPESQRHAGMLVFERAALPSQAPAGLDHVRSLLRLDDPVLLADPRRADARVALLEQIRQAGRALLGASEVHLVLTNEPGAPGDTPFDRELVEEARRRPDALFYGPDLALAPALAAEAERRGVRSIVLGAIVIPERGAIGALEVLTREPDPFRPEDLAMIALLADSCATALERAARIEKLVFIDPLTSAYNRSYFDLQVANEMARAQREQTSIALCIADIDEFKSFNTAFGYEAGNEVLVQVASALKRGVRPFDTVARWGGEEFAVLLTAPVQADDVATVCERLRTLVERMPVRIEGLDRRAHRLGVTISLGVAMFPDHAETPQDLWRAANQALLRAKRPPKNQVVFFSAPRDTRSQAG
jgi:diguanylate cyclase (GGDEF)-like protein